MLKRVALLALAAFLSSPVVAQEAAQCLTLDQAIENTDAAGGKIVGSAKYDGTTTTDTLVVQTPESVLLLGFDAKGCFVGMAVLDTVKKKDVGA